ncbi:hypothetical protein [Acidocella sp. C78]|uniref:hypothetical protein n=1 Tax=Acidocella sp. C78 TaxID=1671486 RepID=UPI00191BA997|nr:hypothetical protein [Acidocella sp. C78]
MGRWRRIFGHFRMFYNFRQLFRNKIFFSKLIPESFVTSVQISQIDTRARLSIKMAAIGEITLVAFTYSFLGGLVDRILIPFVFLLSICYGALIFLGQFWIRSRRKAELLKIFFRIYGALQFLIGFGWGG